MFDLIPQDDYPHATGGETSWREAYSFDFFDSASRLSAFGILGVHPNLQTGDCVFALWRDDILLAKSAKWDYSIPQDIGDERQQFGPLAFRPIAPFKSWEIFYDDGYCRVDLTFDSIHAPYCWERGGDGTGTSASRHYQQQGRYRGVVRVGKDSIPVQGLGSRDHGWGPDARPGMRRWLAASAQFSEKLAFQVLQMTLADGRDLLFGYVFRGSRNEALVSSRLAASYSLRNGAPSGGNLEIVTAGGERLSAVMRVLSAFNHSYQERSLQGFRFLCAAEYQMENQTGFGRLHAYWSGIRTRPEEWRIETPGAPAPKAEPSPSKLDDTVF
ncbi:MAG TPA: hypothetical protein VMV61_07500 [Patescibacteria group bacterium]|nr:hypothetical protein [Patescibacteria group bacterium]